MTKIKKRDLVYFSALGLYLVAKDFEISSAYHTIAWMPRVLWILRYTSYLLIVFISIFLTSYNKKTLKLYCFSLLLILLISIKAGSVTILFNFIFIFAAKDIPIKKLIKYVVAVQTIITLLILLGTLCGVIEDWIYVIDGRYRHSMGYGYPNAIPTIYFYVILALCYLIRERLKIWHLIFFGAINCILFYGTNTRTAFALTTISLIVMWAMKFIRKPLVPTYISKLLYVHSVYLIAIFAILACYFYDPSNPLMRFIDLFISNRLRMGHNALLLNKLTLFGQRIQWYGFGGLGYTFLELAGEYNNVDCSYVKILLDNGVVMLILAIVGYMFVANAELEKGNRYFCVALLFANIYAMIEPRYIETGFNPFVWCLSSLIGNELYLATRRDKLHIKNRVLIDK